MMKTGLTVLPPGKATTNGIRSILQLIDSYLNYLNEEKKREHRCYPKTPLLGVGVLVQNHGNVLVVQRGQAPAKGEWSIPGGLVEIGESLEQAAHREVMEECNIRINGLKRLDLFEYIEKDGKNLIKHHYVVVNFLATFAGGNLAATSDIDAARWVKIEEVWSLPCSESIIKLLRRVRKLLDSSTLRQCDNDPKIDRIR